MTARRTPPHTSPVRPTPPGAGAHRARTAPHDLDARALEALFLAKLPLIRELAHSVARQYRLPAGYVDDFVSDVHLRIIKNDYAVLRRFRGDCTLRTFLKVVISRLAMDWCSGAWGKWRPSLRSQREGVVAVLLERLTMRDGLTFEEACATIATNHRLAVHPRALDGLWGRFKSGGRPYMVSVDDLEREPASSHAADEGLSDAAHRAALQRARGALANALEALDGDDRRLLQLHYEEHCSVAEISRRLALDQKQLYRRMERILQRLRGRLEAAGVAREEVLPALGLNGVDPGEMPAPSEESAGAGEGRVA